MTEEPFPSRWGVKMTAKATPHILSHSRVDRAKPCTQKSTCENSNPRGLEANRVGWKFSRRSLPYHLILIMSRQKELFSGGPICPIGDTRVSNASRDFHFFLEFTDVPLMWSGYFCELLESFTHTLMVPMNTKYLFQGAVANKQYF